MNEHTEEIAISYPANQTIPAQFVCATTNLVKYFMDRGLTLYQIQRAFDYVTSVHK